MLDSLPQTGCAVILGAGGAIGTAMAAALTASGRFAKVDAYARSGGFDITDEACLARIAAAVTASALPLRLVFDATGFLHGPQGMPEKALREIGPAAMAHAFAVNAIGPALAMKHLLPLLPREGKAVFATLSARVGSISDNRLGGWYSYRASKAALNQLVHTAAIELARSRKDAVVVALHPGTVASGLSAPFAKSGLEVHTPGQCAGHLLAVIDRLGAASSGGFFDWRGAEIGW